MRVAHITATKLQWSVRIRWQRSPGRDSLIAFGRDGAVARGGTALPCYLAPAAFSEAEPEVFTLMAV